MLLPCDGLRLGEAPRLGEAETRGAAAAGVDPSAPPDRGLTEEACCSFAIQVLGLRSIRIRPSLSTLMTTAGSQFWCALEWYSTRSFRL